MVDKTGGKTASGSSRKRKSARLVPSGIAHVRASFNNTIVTITDPFGNVVFWGSAGSSNFSGSRKSSSFAASVTAQNVGKVVLEKFGMRELVVFLKGSGVGRESAVRGLQSVGLHISVIKDRTSIPHNGCRPRKRTRS